MSEDIIERFKKLYEKEIHDGNIPITDALENMKKYHDKIKTETYEDFLKRMNYDR